jgi:hypothetical protein
MEEKQVIKALAALAQAHRLQLFRALVVTGAQGLTPAVMAEGLGVPAATLSFHLKELLAYLTQNCCQGEACLAEPATACPC